MPRTVSVGVIGLGGMGTRHALNLHRHVAATRVSAVYDRETEHARAAAAECAGAGLFDDPVQLIGSEAVDAVVIASPDETHVGFVMECLRRGKPVLCEKPLSVTSADAARVIEAERAGGRKLVSVGYMRRFDPQHVAVKQVVESGQIGRPILFKGVHRNATTRNHVPPAVVLAGSASHDIDAARWLLHQEVETVFVQGVRTRPSSSPETTELLLLQMALSGGCLATVEVYVAAGYGYEVSAEIVAQDGTVVTEQPGLALVRSRQARSLPVEMDWLERFQDAYVAELSQWIISVQGGAPFPGADAWDGYVSLLVTDACVQSVRTGAPVPVRVPALPELYL